MNIIKKYLVPFLYSIAIILICLVPITILYYFNITSDKINGAILWIVGSISILVGSYKFSKETKYKGIINGLIYYLIFLIIMIILSLLIFKTAFGYQNIIYYLIILLFSLIGAIIGKNKKTDEN